MTLYGLTQNEAKTLVDYCGTIEVLALALWNKGRAATLERGVYKAQKLVKFANTITL